jgi:hypothetical protein
MTPAISTPIPDSKASTFVVDSTGTSFYVSIRFINDRGQSKTINKTEFSKIVFESVYTSPFVMGHLQLIEHEQQNKFKPAIGSNAANTNYDFTGSGGEFIYISIKQQIDSTKQLIILNKTFIVKNIVESTTGNTPMLNYYFADAEFGALSYNRLPWSTNNMHPDSAQLNDVNRKVIVSDAILNLLNTFCEKTDQYIINTDKWDPSITKTEYTLHANQSPLDALNDLMSKYISKENNDMGLLLRHAGKFKLLSLSNIFKNESTPVASIRITTNDNRSNYTSNETASYFRGKYQLIPVHISNVQFYPKNPDTAVDVIVNHSISSYNTKTKSFNLYNNNGSVVNLKKTFNTVVSHLPASATKEVDIDKTNLTLSNKNQKIVYENSNNSEFLGKTTLQSKLINSADRVSFDIPGNFFPQGGRFIGIEISGIPTNKFMKTVPGFWFVLQNTTTLTHNTFKTFLVSAKLDKEKV